MKHLKLFEEMSIYFKEFPSHGHDISPREYKILTDLVGDLNYFKIKVDDYYYYTIFGGFYNRFDGFNELKDYLLSYYYMFNDKPEQYLELLKTSKLDPSFDRNRSIKWASYNGHIEIVKHLLSDHRVDPSVDKNYTIIDACYNGNIEIVKLLLKDNKLNLIDGVIENGHIEILKLLLNDERIRSKLSLEGINKYTKYTNETS